MSDKEKLDKNSTSDPERTLITLEQLSQTIDVMTSVVGRLRQHLSEQLKRQIEAQQPEDSNEIIPDKKASKIITDTHIKKEESCVVEIRQQEQEPTRKPSKILH